MTTAFLRKLTTMLLVSGVLLLVAPYNFGTLNASAVESVSNLDSERNQFMRKESPWGQYWQFIPNGTVKDILVVVHGTVNQESDPTAIKVSLDFIYRWIDYAKANQLIVLSPAFDTDNYQLVAGGYRGLYGRIFGADEFVINLVNQYKDVVQDFDGRFYLYGHSAGGQFSNRFSVRHPHLLKGLILSAPGRYAFPDKLIGRPYGMGRYTSSQKWGDSPAKLVQVYPDPAGWLAAAQVPTVILVGSQDLELQSHYGQETMTRVELAIKYTADMKAYAAEHGVESVIKLRIVQGAGHSSAAMTPQAQEELSLMLKMNAAK